MDVPFFSSPEQIVFMVTDCDLSHSAVRSIVVTVDASQRPVEFFHLHAAIADYFHHGGQPFQFFSQPTKMKKISCKLVRWIEPLDMWNMIQL